MLAAFVSIGLLLSAVAGQAPVCSGPTLIVNDFLRDVIGRYSTIGELYSDEGSISGAPGGSYTIQPNPYAMRIVAPASRSSYWFMEFEPHCVSWSDDDATPVSSSNDAYHNYTTFTHIVFDLEASANADFAMQMSGGNFAQCDVGPRAVSTIRLSDVHAPDGTRQTVAIPLAAWDTPALQLRSGMHSFLLLFRPNAGTFLIGNIRLTSGCPAAAVDTTRRTVAVTTRRTASATMATSAPATQPLATSTATTPMAAQSPVPTTNASASNAAMVATSGAARLSGSGDSRAALREAVGEVGGTSRSPGPLPSAEYASSAEPMQTGALSKSAFALALLLAFTM